MRKIIFCVSNDLTYDQRMDRICNSLQQSGYSTILVGRKREQSIELEIKSFTQKRLRCFFEKGKSFYLEYNFRLLFFLLFTSCDAICAVDPDTLLPCYIVSRLRKKKLIYDSHEYFTEVPELKNRNLIRNIWKSIQKLCVPKTTLCYTVNTSLAQILSTEYKNVFEVIKNVPSLEKDERTFERQKFIFYQGALNEGRGLEELIKSAKRHSLKIKIAGEGDLSKKLRLLVEELELQDQVEFLGYLKPEDLKKLTPRAFIGFNLLETESLSYYYSLSNKFFDYMHALVPSLSNKLPEYQKINEQYEVAVLTETTVESIVAEVDKLVNEPLYYEKLVANCKEAKRIYCWQVEERKLLELYNALFN